MEAQGSTRLPMAGEATGVEDTLTRNPPITVDVMRGSLLESRHVVYGVILRLGSRDGGAGSFGGEAWGDPSFPTVMRSALKPFQALPLLLDSVVDGFSLRDEELALAAGSHAAQEEHLRVLEGFMRKTGVKESMLRCGGHAPFDPEAARRVGAGWGRRHDNCSGKHTGMIAWCHHAGLDATGYTSREHPVQGRILDRVARLAGQKPGSLALAVDGCSVPTVALTLSGIARLFLGLGSPRSVSAGEWSDDEEARRVGAGLQRVAAAMAANPLMVAGKGRLDTDVGGATDGRLVTKIGAEGVWGGVDREKQVAFAFKAIDGGSRAVAPAALSVLDRAGMLTKRELDALSSHARPVLRDRAGNKVGRILAELPSH